MIQNSVTMHTLLGYQSRVSTIRSQVTLSLVLNETTLVIGSPEVRLRPFHGTCYLVLGARVPIVRSQVFMVLWYHCWDSTAVRSHVESLFWPNHSFLGIG